MEPILTSQGIMYKRNILLICSIASLSLLDGIDISKAKVFDLEVGIHLWTIGFWLLMYHLVSFIFEARQGWLKWEDASLIHKPSIAQLFGLKFHFLEDKRNQSYSRLEFRKENNKLKLREFFYNKDHSPVLENGKHKFLTVSNSDSSEKYKLRKMQFLHFILLDILTIFVGCVFAIYAYFDHFSNTT